MAYIIFDDFIDVGTGGFHEATSYQFATDPDFINIIDENLNDEINLRRWHSMLPKGDGTYYADLDNLYARVMIRVGGFWSPWFTVAPQSQNIQNITITQDGKDPIQTTSEAISLQ